MGAAGSGDVWAEGMTRAGLRRNAYLVQLVHGGHVLIKHIKDRIGAQSSDSEISGMGWDNQCPPDLPISIWHISFNMARQRVCTYICNIDQIDWYNHLQIFRINPFISCISAAGRLCLTA